MTDLMKTSLPKNNAAITSIVKLMDQTVNERLIEKLISTKCPIDPTPAAAMSWGNKNQFSPILIKMSPNRIIGVFFISLIIIRSPTKIILLSISQEKHSFNLC